MRSRNDTLHNLTKDLDLTVPEIKDLVKSLHGGPPIVIENHYVDWRLVKLQLRVIYDYWRWMHKKGNHKHDNEVRQLIRILFLNGRIRNYFRFTSYPVIPDVMIRAAKVFDRRLNREYCTGENLAELYDLCLPIVEPISPQPQSLFVLARNQLFRQATSYGNLPKGVWQSLEEPLLRKVYFDDDQKKAFYTEERLRKFFNLYKETNWSVLLETFFLRILVNWPQDSNLMELRDDIILSYEKNMDLRRAGWQHGLACASALRYAFMLEKKDILASDQTIIQYLNILVTFKCIDIYHDSYNDLMIAYRCLVIICEQIDPRRNTFRKEIIEITKRLLIRLAMHSFKHDQIYIGRNPFRDAFRQLIVLAVLHLDLDPGNLTPKRPNYWIDYMGVTLTYQ